MMTKQKTVHKERKTEQKYQQNLVKAVKWAIPSDGRRFDTNIGAIFRSKPLGICIAERGRSLLLVASETS